MRRDIAPAHSHGHQHLRCETLSLSIVARGVLIATPLEDFERRPGARPGGNITGLTADPTLEILSKELQLLQEATPRLSRVAVVWNSSVPAAKDFYRAGGFRTESWTGCAVSAGGQTRKFQLGICRATWEV